MKSKMARWMVAVAMAALFAAPAFATGQSESTQAATSSGAVNLKFGAMPIGSAWYVYAATFSKLLQDALPNGSNVQVVPQGGGIANPLAVSEHKVNIALSNVATAKWAYDGVQMYSGRQAKNLRALVGGLNHVYAVVIFSKSFVKKTGIDSLQKLAAAKYPVRFITKPEGSLAPPIARMIFAQYGMSFSTIRKWGGSVTQVSAGQIPDMMREGRADLWIDVCPPGQPAVTQGMLTANLEMVSLSEKTINALSKVGLYGATMAANSFPNQTQPVRTVMPGTVIIVRASMPKKEAYDITKAICEGKSTLAASSASLKVFNPEEAWKQSNTGIPLHPGAIEFYKQVGWMK